MSIHKDEQAALAYARQDNIADNLRAFEELIVWANEHVRWRGVSQKAVCIHAEYALANLRAELLPQKAEGEQARKLPGVKPDDYAAMSELQLLALLVTAVDYAPDLGRLRGSRVLAEARTRLAPKETD